MDRFSPPAAAALQHATQNPHTPSFDLQQLLCELAERYIAAAHGSPVALHFDLDAALPRFLLGDGQRLQQLLAHLGSHAIRTCSQAEITLVVEVERLAEAEAALVFSVRDGESAFPGASPCDCARHGGGACQAGQPLRTPGGSHKPLALSLAQRFGGSRQGLAQCLRLAKALGAELELMNPPQRPGHFQLSLCLPLALGRRAPADRYQ